MKLRERIWGVLALFGSTGTLLCCALPATVATVAGGAAVGSMLATLPWLVPLSRFKGPIFIFALAMTILNGILIYRPRSTIACSIAGGQGCETAGSLSKTLFWTSILFIAVGGFFAYGCVPLMRLWE